jgi:hypothetical protein
VKNIEAQQNKIRVHTKKFIRTLEFCVENLDRNKDKIVQILIKISTNTEDKANMAAGWLTWPRWDPSTLVIQTSGGRILPPKFAVH